MILVRYGQLDPLVGQTLHLGEVDSIKKRGGKNEIITRV